MQAAKKLNKKIFIPNVIGNLKEKYNVRKTPLFPAVIPMLASECSLPFDDREWLFEVNWDGYRIIASKENLNVKLTTINCENYSYNFFTIMQVLKLIEHDVILDGEVVILSDENDYESLKDIGDSNKLNCFYYIYDLLWIDGYSLLEIPLIERKNILKMIIPNQKYLRYTEHFKNDGIWLFNETGKMDINGVLAKRADSIYEPGKRVDTWLNIKV